MFCGWEGNCRLDIKYWQPEKPKNMDQVLVHLNTLEYLYPLCPTSIQRRL